MDNTLKIWLSHQCKLLSGVTHAVLLTGLTDDGTFDHAIHWPDKSSDRDSLSRVCQAAVRNKQAVIKTRNNKKEKTGEPLDAMACPLFLQGALFGVIAIELTHRAQPLQRAAVKQVLAGAKWLEAMIRMQSSAADEQWRNLVDMVAIGLENEKFKVAATEVTNELAERFGCQRVSLGFLIRSQVRIEAVSHCTRIDQDANDIGAIQDAMLEALDQGASVVFPAGSEAVPLITRFHERLAQINRGVTICTLPLVKNGKAVGAVLLERATDAPFTAEAVAKCEQIGLLLGPVLETRRRDERPLPRKIMDTLGSCFSAIFGPRHLALKLVSGAFAVLVVWLSLAGATLRISCDSELEAMISRVIAAPQQGYIAEAHVRAGDIVREGQLMASLDDKELRLEQRKWQSQRAQMLKEYRKALSARDRAEIAIITAKRAQAEAQLSLIEQQLARTTLLAPFSGMVVNGDLSQSLGSPVTRGEVLYQVAPTDEYRVVLKVDDRDIGLISVGQRGQMKLSGIPHEKIEITIERMTPVSSVDEGRNYFRVEATMARHSDLMRPGMKGIAKIEICQSKLLWTWSRPLVDWLRLFAWNRMP